jgi:hypothetical protein
VKGRPLRGLIGGLLLGIFVDVDLVFGGVVKLESVVLTILPIALLVVGLLLGLWAPVGRSKISVPTMARSGSLPSVPSNVTTTSSATPPNPAPPAPGAPTSDPTAGEDTPPI